MQAAWERSVAATARTGEDVHSGPRGADQRYTAQQLTTLLMMIVAWFSSSMAALVGALVAATMLAGRVLAPITGIAAVITRASRL